MQYVFIFQALLEHYLYGDTELEVTSLESHLNKLYAPLPGAGCGGMEAEFKVAQTAFFLAFWKLYWSGTMLKCSTCFIYYLFLSFRSLPPLKSRMTRWEQGTCLPTWRKTVFCKSFHVSCVSMFYNQTVNWENNFWIIKNTLPLIC